MDQRAAANVHYTLLIACVLVAFFLGAILSGFMVSCYCGRSAAQRARRLGKDPEASLPHALSLRSLAKLNGLLDIQPKDDKLDMSTPMYSSFIPNGRAEPHLQSPAHQGLSLGDAELSLSQGDGELSGLPTPDSTPELPLRNMTAPQHHRRNDSRPGGASGSELSFMAVVGTQQGFPFSHPLSSGLSNGAAHGAGASSSSLHLLEDQQACGDERAGGGGPHHRSQQSLPQAAADVSALDELLRHIHEVSASGTGGIKVLTSSSSSSLFPGPSSSAGCRHPGQTRTHHYNHSHHYSNHHNNNGGLHHQQQIPETDSAPYHSTSTLPRDSAAKRPDAPPQNCSSSSSCSSSNNPTASSSSSTPLQQQVISERPGVSVTRHHSRRHSLIKMGSGGGVMPRHHSFNQRGASHAHFLARMNTNSSSNGPPPSQRPSVSSACLTRQHSYSEGPHARRAGAVRRTVSLKPQLPPKPLFLPNTATAPTAEAGKYDY